MLYNKLYNKSTTNWNSGVWAITSDSKCADDPANNDVYSSEIMADSIDRFYQLSRFSVPFSDVNHNLWPDFGDMDSKYIVAAVSLHVAINCVKHAWWRVGFQLQNWKMASKKLGFLGF